MITSILRELHWLQVHKRSKLKLLTLVHKARIGQAPKYLSEFVKEYKQARTLPSASQSKLCVPQVKDIQTVRYGERSFRKLGPVLYNSLPDSLKNLEIQGFRSALKTHLFNE